MPQHTWGARRPNVLTMVERLRPLTLRRCKPAIPFGGTLRVIDFTLMNCVPSGLTQIHVLTQYRAESLDRHCRRRWNSRSVLGEGHVNTPPPNGLGSYRGTADAVYKNLGLLDLHKPEAVLVLSGDHVYHAIGNRRWQTTRPVAIIVVQAVRVVVESVWVDRGVFRRSSLETG